MLRMCRRVRRSILFVDCWLPSQLCVERRGTGPVLGKSRGLSANAEKIGGRHLMGSTEWEADVLEAISNPKTKISAALDGLPGSGSASSRVMAAVQRASSGTLYDPFDWELMQLYQSGRLSTTSFYEGGRAIANPFG